MTLSYTNTPRPPNNGNEEDRQCDHVVAAIDDVDLDHPTDADEILAPSAEVDVYPGAFEGPEKLLEIWFTPGPQEENLPPGSPKTGLKSVDRAVWEDMLKLVKCQVLSVLHDDSVDAYLLSESSMFVYPHKLILKTCGTTTLLIGIERILEIAKSCNLHRVFRVFYSRKSFMFPEKQLHPHRDWKDELAMLDEYFDNGSSYIVGPTNGDHWLLYLTSPSQDVLLSNFSQVEASLLAPRHPLPRYRPISPPDSPRPANNNAIQSAIQQPQQPDETIEILMTHLDPVAMAPFFLADASSPAAHVGGELATRIKGIDTIYKDARIDSYLFEPCGYSANGVVSGGNYFTIHVTPEPEASYASFESNVPLVQAGDDADCTVATRKLIRKVLDIFRPGKFSVTLFVSALADDEEDENDDDVNNSLEGKDGILSPREVLAHRRRDWVNRIGRGLNGYKRKDKIVYEFDGYDLMFGCFEKAKPAAS